MKILVFISKLYGGGAERVASLLINHLCKNHKVTVAIFNDKNNHYYIDDKVLVMDLSSGNKIRPYQFDRIIKCRKAIKDVNPDLIISFLVDLNRFVLISNCFSRKKLLLSEQTSIQSKQSLNRRITRHILYRLATKVVFTSRSDFEYARWLRNKTFIYNPLSFDIINKTHQRENVIVAIGSQRHWNVKGFDLLTQAWARIALSYPNWKLQFLGETNDNKIEELVKSYNIESQVEFLGWKENIDEVLQTKSIYVLSSRREGFPCSLLEAMSQGCACVAFNCNTGPNEIITDGESGLLARNGHWGDLAYKIQMLIDDEQLRKKISEGAIVEVKRFNKDLIMRQWDELIRLT